MSTAEQSGDDDDKYPGYPPAGYPSERGDKPWETIVKTKKPFTSCTKNPECKSCHATFSTQELYFTDLGNNAVSEKDEVEDTDTKTNFSSRFNFNRRSNNYCGKRLCQKAANERIQTSFAKGKEKAKEAKEEAAGSSSTGHSKGFATTATPSKKHIAAVANAAFEAANKEASKLGIGNATGILVHVGADSGGAGNKGNYSTVTNIVDSKKKVEPLSAAVRKLVNVYLRMSDATAGSELNEVRNIFEPYGFRGV